MFGLGIWEFVIVVVVGLIVLGPRRLPELARQLGRLMREFRRASNELRHGLDDAVRTDDAARRATPYDDPERLPKLTELRVDPTQVPDAGPQPGTAQAESTTAQTEPTTAQAESTTARDEPTTAQTGPTTAQTEPTVAESSGSQQKDVDRDG